MRGAANPIGSSRSPLTGFPSVMKYETTVMRPNPDKADWEAYADTTAAHERGSQAKEQLKAEGRRQPSGLDPRIASGALRPIDAKDPHAVERDLTPAHERGSHTDAEREAERESVARVAGEDEVPADLTPAHERDGEDLGALTVKDLKARAKDAGVTGYSSMNKDELIAALS